MTNPIEIAPEIRELLEDIVADPRSSIRLAPRKALSTWFTSDETISARGYDHTKAERHLLEVHRETVAELLFQAARVAYWKKPAFALMPLGKDGRAYNPADAEPSLLRRMEREARSSSNEGVALLRQCLNGVGHENAAKLARASLGLMASDKTRYMLALSFPWERPRPALGLMRRLASKAQPTLLRSHAFHSVGARLCALGLESEALEAYRSSITLNPDSPVGRFGILNLSVYLGDSRSAEVAARELEETITLDDQQLISARSVLEQWIETKKGDDLARAAKIARQVGESNEIARALVGVYKP